jgi:hypothetical protein
MFFTLLTAVAAASQQTLVPGQSLAAGGQLVSGNGKSLLKMQKDGNLVVRQLDGSIPLWSSKTSAQNASLKFLEDGNLVIEAAGGKQIWQTKTAGATEVTLQPDCNFVAVRGSTQLWASNSKCAATPAPTPSPPSPPPSPTPHPSPLPANPLNVLMIISDQHRWDALSEAGNAVIRTPNLDKLAQSGVTFTKAYTICQYTFRQPNNHFPLAHFVACC